VHSGIDEFTKSKRWDGKVKKVPEARFANPELQDVDRNTSQ